MKLKHNIYFKIGIIVILVLLLMIPTALVKSVINERQFLKESTIQEVSSKWGDAQTLAGPFISIPYNKIVKEYSQAEQKYKTVVYREWIHFLPEQLTINGNIDPEKRSRRIYEVVVYNSEFEISGFFKSLDLKSFDIPIEQIQFDKATFNIGISDLKGIEKQIELDWNDQKAFFNSGTSSNDIVVSGISVPIKLAFDDSTDYQFNFKLSLKGSQSINFTPVGKTSDVHLSSNWPTPSFVGNFLPDDRSINEQGFTADWNILHLNRNYPQAWIGNAFRLDDSEFGTSLLLPVDNYQRAYRVAKYAILFLVLTFTVFFFVEVMNHVFIHPMQYLLVGIALVIFYSLLLSISEHIVFNWSYIISTVLTLGLITAYTYAILKSKKLALLIFSILLLLYLFIFTIIQLEDYALLIGSIGMFIILAIVMYYSRTIDWYQIKLGDHKTN
ncbi:MAG: cell envelope integrity protein CreD [Bacteroidales bacterium]|nr:cell envelope integrity protein CreD [Bacteroidales bacterium]